MAKTQQEIDTIYFGIQRISEIMEVVHPEKKWHIEYCARWSDNGSFNEWYQQRFGLYEGQEYILIYDVSEDMEYLLYAINVSANSPMCIFSELMDLLADKF